MTWEQICDLWDGGSVAEVRAPYGDGEIRVRPTPDSFEYTVRGHKVQQDRDWRPRDLWYDLAAANGDFRGMRYSPATGEQDQW